MRTMINKIQHSEGVILIYNIIKTENMLWEKLDKHEGLEVGI